MDRTPRGQGVCQMESRLLHVATPVQNVEDFSSAVGAVLRNIDDRASSFEEPVTKVEAGVPSFGERASALAEKVSNVVSEARNAEETVTKREDRLMLA